MSPAPEVLQCPNMCLPNLQPLSMAVVSLHSNNHMVNIWDSMMPDSVAVITFDYCICQAITLLMNNSFIYRILFIHIAQFPRQSSIL